MLKRPRQLSFAVLKGTVAGPADGGARHCAPSEFKPGTASEGLVWVADGKQSFTAAIQSPAPLSAEGAKGRTLGWPKARGDGLWRLRRQHHVGELPCY